MVTTTGNVKC